MTCCLTPRSAVTISGTPAHWSGFSETPEERVGAISTGASKMNLTLRLQRWCNDGERSEWGPEGFKPDPLLTWHGISEDFSHRNGFGSTVKRSEEL